MSKNNRILIAIFVLLIIAFLVVRYTKDPRERREKFFKVNIENIASIEMKTVRDTLVISNDGFDWYIDYPFHFEIEQTRLNNFFTQVLPVETSSTPVALSEESFPNYQVTEDRGTVLKFFDRNAQLIDSAIIGRSGTFAYARRSEDNRVYQLFDNISFMVNPNLNQWRSNNIVSIPRGQISSIDVTYELNQYTITATDTLWLFTDQEHTFSIPENNNNLRRILTKIERMNLINYIDYQYEDYMSLLLDPQLILTIRLINDTVTSLIFAFDIDNENFIVQRDDMTDHLFIIDTDTVDLFTRSPQHFED
ncbi:MAG: DUF4340 domain-containing protein [Candidatus Cloacimonetes bacterium]|nr:DUF4340 domain-containing protein [Candidatus Cloacimonadota bacterium]